MDAPPSEDSDPEEATEHPPGTPDASEDTGSGQAEPDAGVPPDVTDPGVDEGTGGESNGEDPPDGGEEETPGSGTVVDNPCEVLQRFDFDASDDGWQASGNNSDWAWGSSGGPGGGSAGSSARWGTSTNGSPQTCQCSFLQSPDIDLATHAGSNLWLTFWHWQDFRKSSGGFLCGSDSYSGGRVELSSGSNWSETTPTNGYDGSINCSGGNSSCEACALDEAQGFTSSGSQGVWQREVLDLSRWTAASLQVRFGFGNHASYPCYPSGAGWYIDRVTVWSGDDCLAGD